MRNIKDRVVDEILLTVMQVHTFVMCYFQIPELFASEEYEEYQYAKVSAK